MVSLSYVIVQNSSQINVNSSWKDAIGFQRDPQKPLIYQVKGNSYEVISMKSKKYSCLERVKRIFQGLLALIKICCRPSQFSTITPYFTDTHNIVSFIQLIPGFGTPPTSAAPSNATSAPPSSAPVPISGSTEPKILSMPFPTFTRCQPSNFLYAATSFTLLGSSNQKITKPPSRADEASAQFILDRRYFNRKDVAYLDKDNGVVHYDSQPKFAYCHPLTFKEPFDPTELKNLLANFTAAFKDKASSIPKLFIPTGVFPKYGIPHAILIVVEVDPKDFKKARYTVVNSFGVGSYAYHVNNFIQVGKEVFSSPSTKIVENQVSQQQDGWTCGWHMTENIELLSKCDNVQDFVAQNKLPVRSTKEIENLCLSTYKQYGVEGGKVWYQHYSHNQTKDFIKDIDRANGKELFKDIVLNPDL